MATKKSKRYVEAAKLVDQEKSYPLDGAVELLGKFPAPKFDETVTLSFHLGVDPRKSDQMVRGTCPLPHGSGKKVRVLVLASGDAAAAATKAGAEFVGYEEMIKKVQEGFTDFDVAVATPDAMAEVRKLGRQLGPRGLMPNPKTGTVTNDTAEAVNAVKAGRVDYKIDRGGNVAVAIGKVSFEPAKLIDNANAIIESVLRAKPPGAKGRYINSISLAATMSPSVPLDLATYQA
ncbi:MAG: 50S ribosomal protein L1 [Verrucomicrobiales bacterium]|nr:50S ribosomal protein L1 [Verrucomicrobiales bacterium]